jgi:hypothetical protein
MQSKAADKSKETTSEGEPVEVEVRRSFVNFRRAVSVEKCCLYPLCRDGKKGELNR